MKIDKTALKNNINYCLNNENGSPYLQYIAVLAVSMCVGAGLFIIGRYMKKWFINHPNAIVDTIPNANRWRKEYRWN